MLSQRIDGEEHSVGFASRQLNTAEQKYLTVERELLAVVWAMGYLRCYLYGRPFILVTDHAPLKWFLDIRDTPSRIARWQMKLAEFSYSVEYKPGKLNQNADILSRAVRAVDAHPHFGDMERFKKEQEEDTSCKELLALDFVFFGSKWTSLQC